MSKYIPDAGCVNIDGRLFAFMVSRARMRDRQYFCSDATAARELGVSRRTVLRARSRLEAAGRIVREGLRRHSGIRATVVYSFPVGHRRMPRVESRVTQRSSSRRSTTPTPPYGRSGRSRVGAWLFAMTDLVPKPDEAPPVPAKAITAQDIIAALVDLMKANGVPVSSRAKGVLAKQTKQLLADGFTPQIVSVAALVALRRSAPHLCDRIAQDLALTLAGQAMTRDEYRREVQKLDPQANVMHERIRNAVRRRLAK